MELPDRGDSEWEVEVHYNGMGEYVSISVTCEGKDISGELTDNEHDLIFYKYSDKLERYESC